jgi:uncharacterized membrane protein YqiK
MSDTTHSEPKTVPLAASIAVFIILFLILAVFADTFIFVLGTIGLVVTFAFFGDKAHGDDHH